MPNSAANGRPERFGGDIGLSAGLGTVVLFFVISGAISYLNTRTLSRGMEQVARTHDTITTLEDVMSLLKDAETGQRGFVLTGDERYLAPHTAAVGNIYTRLQDLERLTADSPEQAARVPAIKEHVRTKIRELEETIVLRRTKGFEAARAVVETDRGKNAMDSVRAQVEAMEQTEREVRKSRLAAAESAYTVTVVSGVLSGALGVALSGVVGYLVRRSVRAGRRQEWLLAGQTGLSQALVGDRALGVLGERALAFLAEYLGAHAGAFFAKDGGTFRRVATYGVPAGGAPDRIGPDDGLAGQAIKAGRSFLLRDLPAGYLTVGSALGRGTPEHLAVVPLTEDGAVNAVIELGFVRAPRGDAAELLDRVAEDVGLAVRSANYRAHLKDLLEETQRQSEELQAQTEELRVSNEELDEQGRALRETQSRLELQQTELEQTNAQLEEQAQLLEVQRDEATRAKGELQVQARELERASRYKSDFLANMSHELRTPLNSSLILAKLLADNRDGNLTAEQVRYAETIRAAGNDLLALINDILDLSKIEAGHMEVRPGPVPLASLAEDLTRVFQPIADEKKLGFAVRLAPGCPEGIETDRQRLEQVLKNLLSNALKFTESGEVALEVRAAPGDRIAFSVRDTGIGIAEHQQQMVFEAFRQADGTTNRKHGGTGLGLSIARELARLLGGDIHLASEPGRGSTFTVTIPTTYDPAHVRPRAEAPAAPPTPASKLAVPPHAPAVAVPQPLAHTAPARVPVARRVEDDREKLSGDRRVILIVEDDAPFARIVVDLAHELGFQCLVAATAEEALAVAVQYRPSAVVLDVGLPDNSGLSVLDRLKRDARTRHVPVHVVSAGDHAQTALALGAVGYMLKPVKREQLAGALQQLETRLERRLRRVLIVEDDPVQRDSLCRLLGTADVETVAVGTAAECLERLKTATFDCMVLDLSLPDASGYALLETLSAEDAYSFPPVIVYTGRSLSADEEQKLRKYSKSIIIKGAKSPERLLDEVTLFLHQVVSELPSEQQRMLEQARNRDAALEGRRILVVEDDVRNVFALTSILEPRGAIVQIARNGLEALRALDGSAGHPDRSIDLVLMDVMMPEMDGLTATRELRKKPSWKKLPVIMLTAKAMKDDQEQCLAAGANDYMAKPLDVEKLLSLVRVWMPR
ncbi:response regulator [Gemmata sp. JC717]|uniref:response regulator n=1 Tax=Gemmata algarum TaxID=2975278 RepID=UPI0021BAFF3F|nr:response regulator [Gemmata algarum]MDY3556395.1 response regulator [Gemmata algarum]